MKIAVAGGGTLSYLITGELCKDGDNSVIVLSTEQRTEFESNYDCQLFQVDYGDADSLRFVLQGVDLVISTICGMSQMNLISAARRARVRHFVPAEFEGSPTHRGNDDAMDEYRGSKAALAELRRLSQSSSSRSSSHHPMSFTVFTCGLFYDRFHPEGLAAYNMGTSQGIDTPGIYLADMVNATAEVVELNAAGRPVHVCMTSLPDVAKFVAAAVEHIPLANWPKEFRMRGDRLTIKQLLQVCERIRGVTLDSVVYNYTDLHAYLDQCAQQGDNEGCQKFQRLITTADGRYDYTTHNLNDAVGSEVEPVRFKRWLERAYASYVASYYGTSGSGSASGSHAET